MNVERFIDRYQAEAFVTPIQRRPDGVRWGVNHWRVDIRLGMVQGRSFMLYYSGGSAVHHVDLQDVLESVQMDFSMVEMYAGEVREYARDLGLDYEEAEWALDKTDEQRENFIEAFGELVYEDFMSEDRDD